MLLIVTFFSASYHSALNILGFWTFALTIQDFRRLHPALSAFEFWKCIIWYFIHKTGQLNLIFILINLTISSGSIVKLSKNVSGKGAESSDWHVSPACLRQSIGKTNNKTENHINEHDIIFLRLFLWSFYDKNTSIIDQSAYNSMLLTDPLISFFFFHRLLVTFVSLHFSHCSNHDRCFKEKTNCLTASLKQLQVDNKTQSWREPNIFMLL